MAVTVEGLPFVVLDPDDRVVEAGPAAPPVFADLVGRSVLEAFPGSAPLFGPYYAKARRTGERVEFVQFFDGYLVRVVADPGERGLVVAWQTLGMLDVLTLEGMRASLAAILEQLEAARDELARAELRRSLRVLEGGP